MSPHVVTISKGAVEDLGAIAELGKSFATEGKFEFNPEAWVRMWTAILESGWMGEMLVARRAPDQEILGVLGIIFAPSLMTGKLQAQEGCWFVQPEARGCGLALLKSAEARARERGAHTFTMAHLSGLNERLALIYGRRGYQQIETMYALTL